MPPPVLLDPNSDCLRRPCASSGAQADGLGRTQLHNAYTQDEATAHGFRATASTLLNESGKWAADAIERQLAHVESNDVRRAYARGKHWDERVKMMAWWADYLDQLMSTGKVVQIDRKLA